MRIRNERRMFSVAVAAACLSMTPALAEDAAEVEIDPMYTWALEDVFESVEAWEAAGAAVEARIPSLEACEGEYGDSAGRLQECLDNQMETFRQFSLYSGWAGNHANEDLNDQEWQERMRRTEAKTEAGLEAASKAEALHYRLEI